MTGLTITSHATRPGEAAVTVADRSITLAAKVVDAVAMAHGLPVPGLAGALTEALLRELITIHDEQGETLRRIEGAVQSLIAQPWQTAQMHLKEATLPGRSPQQIALSLDRAGLDLRAALTHLSAKTQSRVYVSFDLAVVLTILGEAAAGRMYARESLRTATDLLLDEEHKDQARFWGQFTPKAAWPDPKAMRRYQPADSVSLQLALDWLKLALAVGRLTGDHTFVHGERWALTGTTLIAIERLAAGDHAGVERFLAVNRDPTRSLPSPPVQLPPWQPADIPALPDWWFDRLRFGPKRSQA